MLLVECKVRELQRGRCSQTRAKYARVFAAIHEKSQTTEQPAVTILLQSIESAQREREREKRNLPESYGKKSGKSGRAPFTAKKKSKKIKKKKKERIDR